MYDRQEIVTCLTCKHSQQIKIYPYINTDETPELKQQVLNHELLLPHCEQCHQPLDIIYPCVYHDKQQKLLIYVAPFYQPGDERTLIYDLFEHRQQSEGYHLRVVTDFSALVESLQLFYHQLNDRIYLIAKQLISEQIQVQIAPCELISGVIQIGYDNQLCFHYIDDRQQTYDIEIDHDIVNIVKQQYAQQWSNDTDFELIDMVWAKQQLEAWL